MAFDDSLAAPGPMPGSSLLAADPSLHSTASHLSSMTPASVSSQASGTSSSSSSSSSPPSWLAVAMTAVGSAVLTAGAAYLLHSYSIERMKAVGRGKGSKKQLKKTKKSTSQAWEVLPEAQPPAQGASQHVVALHMPSHRRAAGLRRASHDATSAASSPATGAGAAGGAATGGGGGSAAAGPDFSPGSLPSKFVVGSSMSSRRGAPRVASFTDVTAAAAAAAGPPALISPSLRSVASHASLQMGGSDDDDDEGEMVEEDEEGEGEEEDEDGEGNVRDVMVDEQQRVAGENKDDSQSAAAAMLKRAISHHGSEGAVAIHSQHAPDPIAANILRKEPEQETFVRLQMSLLDTPSIENMEVCELLQECLALREKYVFREEQQPWRKPQAELPVVDPKDPFRFDPQPASEHVFAMVDGVVRVYANKDATEELFPVLDATSFFTDLHRVLKITSLGHVRSLGHHRLRLLEQKFNLHLMLNADREFMAQKSAPHRDFYNVRKVDTHVHHSACMNQKHLLRFIKSKLRKEPDEVVIFRDGKYLTLKEVFESLDMTGYDLNVDLLDVHADKNTFHRFDKFNLKYNPCGQSRLREIFIKQDNLIQGRFLAEVTKEVFTDLVASKYQMAEYRVSIYGRKMSEWDQLASWVVNNDLYCENVVWLIQLPRLFSVYKEMGILDSFQTMLDNIFLPLFEVTVDPSSHPHLSVLLNHVVGFDMVDDESRPERRVTKHMQTPAEWVVPFNPAYSYYAYYVYANLFTLNKLREAKGLSTIKFRPHSGEAGDPDHLVSTFLLSHNIAHGNNLRRSPALQYLYYLAQIGLAMSPLSNNSLFLDYHKNPFPTFFSRGLNVSLSTDDPLMIHLTKEPLVEEYSVAAQVWKLSSCDLCEIARNSVYQSGFSHPVKSHWIGPNYYKRGPAGNDIHRTNVPHIRMEFRYETWQNEMQYVHLGNYKFPEEISS